MGAVRGLVRLATIFSAPLTVCETGWFAEVQTCKILDHSGIVLQLCAAGCMI